MTQRVYGLDFVRGICAAFVCLYHVLSWSGGPKLYTIGTYGVYVFFAVSGASLYIGYANKLVGNYELKRFYVRRYFRLAPLYIGVVCVGLALQALTKAETPGAWQILLNFSLLFGFAGAGSTSLAVGGWSIGIEVIYYFLFPLLLPIMKGRHWLWVLLLSFIIQHAYVAWVLSSGESLTQAWDIYTQPISFVFYFIAGMAIGKFVLDGMIRPKPTDWGVIAGCFLLMFAMVGDESKDTLIAPAGLLLSIASVIIAWRSSALHFKGRWLVVAELIGTASFGLYLIHPFVYSITKSIVPQVVKYPWAMAAYTLAVSAVLAVFVDRYYERPVRRWLESKILPKVALRAES